MGTKTHVNHSMLDELNDGIVPINVPFCDMMDRRSEYSSMKSPSLAYLQKYDPLEGPFHSLLSLGLDNSLQASLGDFTSWSMVPVSRPLLMTGKSPHVLSSLDPNTDESFLRIAALSTGTA